MDNIKTWTGLSVEESVRMSEDRDKWRKYVHGVARLKNKTKHFGDYEFAVSITTRVLYC